MNLKYTQLPQINISKTEIQRSYIIYLSNIDVFVHFIYSYKCINIKWIYFQEQGRKKTTFTQGWYAPNSLGNFELLFHDNNRNFILEMNLLSGTVRNLKCPNYSRILWAFSAGEPESSPHNSKNLLIAIWWPLFASLLWVFTFPTFKNITTINVFLNNKLILFVRWAFMYIFLNLI